MRYSARSLPSHTDKIPMFSGRPIREDSISKDDVINLIIALAVNHDVATFCDDKHVFRS